MAITFLEEEPAQPVTTKRNVTFLEEEGAAPLFARKKVAPPPEPEQPFFALEDAVSAIGTIPEALAVGVPAAFKRLVTGTAMPEESEVIERDLAFQERMQREQEDRQAAGKSSVVGEAIRGATPSLGSTIGSGGAAVAGGFLGLLGGPAAKVTVPAGIATASGLASYRMAASDLLYRSFRELEKSKGSPLTDEEKAKAYEVFLPLAQESGLWEAGPEAVSNVLLAGAGKFIFGFGKPVADKIVKESLGRVTTELGKKVAAGTGALAGELAGETTTAVGQFPAQAKAEQFIRTGTTEGAPTEYPGGVTQAFKDVAPSTIALTAGLGLVGGGVKLTTMPFQRQKSPEQIEEDNINLDAEREADNLLIPDNDAESKSIKAQIDSERADLVVKKELYNSLPEGDKARAVLATEIKEYEGRITQLDNTLRQRLGLSVTITPVEQRQIELARGLAEPAAVTEEAAVAVTPTEAQVAEAPAVTPAEKTYVQLENEAIDIQNKINEEEGVSALIGVSDNAITLSGLESREKGKGTRALEIITQEADKNNTPISLKAESKTGETQRLKEFYMRFGFVNDPSFSPESNRMIRYPNATPAITPAPAAEVAPAPVTPPPAAEAPAPEVALEPTAPQGKLPTIKIDGEDIELQMDPIVSEGNYEAFVSKTVFGPKNKVVVLPKGTKIKEYKTSDEAVDDVDAFTDEMAKKYGEDVVLKMVGSAETLTGGFADLPFETPLNREELIRYRTIMAGYNKISAQEDATAKQQVLKKIPKDGPIQGKDLDDVVKMIQGFAARTFPEEGTPPYQYFIEKIYNSLAHKAKLEGELLSLSEAEKVFAGQLRTPWTKDIPLAKRVRQQTIDVARAAFGVEQIAGVLPAVSLEQAALPTPSRFRSEAGGVLLPSREDLIQAGQNIYEAGMEFGAWAKQMIQRFGDAVRQFLAYVWEAVSGFPAKLEEMAGYLPGKGERGAVTFGKGEEPKKPAEEKITDPATPDEQTQQLVQQAQEQESLVDAAVKEAGDDVFNVFNKLVNEGKTEEQVSQELGISKFEVRKFKLRADTAILNKMKQKKVQPLTFQPKNPVVDFAEKNAKKYFTKEGWLPKMVYQSWVKRNAALSREQKEAEYAIKDLYDGIRKVFGISKMEMITKGLVSVPPEFVQQLNDALAGQIDINTMPEPVREPLTRMRQHVDAMSRQLVALNVLPDDLSAKISDNLGVYLTRSYKIFTDKNWINKIPQEKLNNARNFLYKQQLKSDPTATLETADRELRNMLNDWASEAEGLRKRGGKLGAKDLSVMMKRAEVPKVLREVMGENMNVVFNYANTIGKISRFLADQRFLNEVKVKGTGQFLFTAADAPKGFNTQIAAEESRTMSPLNGLRTTPEIAKAFEEFGKGYDAKENPFLYALGWMNAVGKLNLTVGSILTQMRNLLGQPAFFVFNGHYNWAVIRQEVDAIAKDKGISKEDAKRELIKQAAAQGLVNENAYAGELRTAFQEVGLETFDDAGPDEFVKEFVLTRMFKQGVRSAQDLYQKTDEFGKLVGWLNETKRIQRMNKGMDKATAQSIAAERTRDTYPTYSQSSEALRLFRRQPFIGPFATFFYETFRTSFHNLRYAFEDMKGPTPEHRAEGRKRLAGAMAQLSAGAFAVNLISQALSNIGDDEEEDVRRMLPPWAKDASILWMPKSKDGTYNFINLSYINPYNALTDPFIAMMSGFAKGEKPEEIATQAFGSFLSPFVDEQPVSAAIVDAMRNRTETGKQVYNPQDDIATKTSKIMLHIFGKTFTPGTLARLNQRIIPAIEGETVGTRAPAPVREVTAELTGIRFETLDMKAAFSNKAWEFSKAANESERIFRDVATRRRRVNEQEQIDAYRRSEQTRYEIWNEMYRDYMAVRRAGASQSEAVRLMTDIGISKIEAQAIARGRYKPYEVSDEVRRRSKLNGNTVPLTQIKAIGREMPRVLTDIAAE